MYKKLVYSLTITIFTIAQTIDVPEGFGVPFDVEMQINSLYDHTIAAQSNHWITANALYNNHIIDELEIRDVPRIPKIIHQIWIGPRPLPAACKKFQATWIKVHPDWEYKLWTNEDIENFELTNKKLYDQSTNWGQKSDIARYEILYRFGGLYIDTDFECFFPFDLFHHTCDFYAGIVDNRPSKFLIANGLIGSVPYHPILKAIIDNMTLDKTEDQGDRNRIMETTGPYYFTRSFLKHALQSNRCVAFPVGYFYPWPSYEKHNKKREQILQWIRPETFAIHHWHCSWMK